MDAHDIEPLESRVKQLTSDLQAARAQLEQERQEHFIVAAALQHHQSQLHHMLNSIEAGIAYVDSERRYQFVNHFYEVRFHQGSDSILGKHVWEVIGKTAYNSVKTHIDQVLAGTPQSFDFEITYQDGQTAYINCSLTPALGDDQQLNGYYLFVFDITKRRLLEESLKVANAELEELVSQDALTKVANRRKFDEFLGETWSRALRYQEPLSLIMLDIDCFKAYNDHFGHQAGDICLVAVAQTIKAAAQRATDLVARYGGEEFGVVLPDTDLQGAVMIAKQILTAVRALELPHADSLAGPIVSVSLGVHQVMPSASTSIEALIEATDQALYLAKQRGRDRYVVSTYASSCEC